MKKAILLILFITISLTFYNFESESNHSFLNVNRTINANAFDLKDPNDISESFLSEQDVYDYDYNNTEINFTGEERILSSSINGFENMDTNSNTLVQSIDASYDLSTNIYNYSASLTDDNGILVDYFEITLEPIFVTNDNQTEIYFELDGELIALSTVYENNCIQNLFDDTISFDEGTGSGGGGVIIFVITIVPYVVEAIDIIVDNTTELVVSTISMWWQTITQTLNGSNTTTVISQSYTVNIEGEDYNFVVLTQAKINSLSSTAIYVAIADSYTGLIWISSVTIDEGTAASIIFSEKWITSLAGSKTLYLSTYTVSQARASSIAFNAFGMTPYPSEVHGGTVPGYYKHFHATKELVNGFRRSKGHSFYGNPTT